MRVATIPLAPASGHLACAPLPLLREVSRLKVASAQWPPAGRSGDLVDVHRDLDGGATIFLGDVSGNGPSVAPTAERLRRLVRRHVHHCASLRGGFEALSDDLSAELASDAFITAVAARIDARGRTVRVVSAGHLGPFVRRCLGGSQPIATRPGLPLGIVRGQRYPHQARLELDAEDTIVFATDGVTDRFATRQDECGEAGLLAELGRLPARPAALCRRLLWSRPAQLTSDATVLAVQVGNA
jgi:serine phosphatase RsbU (regulator of sigma subunit)